jgi:hypothetical protein
MPLCKKNLRDNIERGSGFRWNIIDELCMSSYPSTDEAPVAQFDDCETAFHKVYVSFFIGHETSPKDSWNNLVIWEKMQWTKWIFCVNSELLIWSDWIYFHVVNVTIDGGLDW